MTVWRRELSWRAFHEESREVKILERAETMSDGLPAPNGLWKDVTQQFWTMSRWVTSLSGRSRCQRVQRLNHDWIQTDRVLWPHGVARSWPHNSPVQPPVIAPAASRSLVRELRGQLFVNIDSQAGFVVGVHVSALDLRGA